MRLERGAALAHPQKQKLGQTVQRKRTSFFVLFDLTDFIPSYLMLKMPEMKDLVTAESLEMHDFSWIPENSSSEAPPETEFLKWEGEQTRTNQETSNTENRPIKGYHGVTLKRLNSRTLEVKKIRFHA